MPLHILQNVNEDMEVMYKEIFGPILPIMTFTDITEVPNKIEPRRNPLAMGAYHGPEGFRNMSHARAMYSQSMIDVLPIIGARPLTVVPAYRLFFRRRRCPVD